MPKPQITIDFSANPLQVVAGEPALLKFVVTDPNGMPVMHTDAELKIVSGEYVALRTGGMMGVLHGHTGEIAVSTVFETPVITSQRSQKSQ